MSGSDPLRSGALFRLNQQAVERLRSRPTVTSTAPKSSTKSTESELHRQVQAKFDAIYRSTPNPMAALLGGGGGGSEAMTSGALLKQQQLLQQQRQQQLLQQQRQLKLREQDVLPQRPKDSTQHVGGAVPTPVGSQLRHNHQEKSEVIVSPRNSTLVASVGATDKIKSDSSTNFDGFVGSDPVSIIPSVAACKTVDNSAFKKSRNVKRRITVENISSGVPPTTIRGSCNTSSVLPVEEEPTVVPVVNVMSTGSKPFRRGRGGEVKPPTVPPSQKSDTRDSTDVSTVPPSTSKTKVKKRVQVENISRISESTTPTEPPTVPPSQKPDTRDSTDVSTVPPSTSKTKVKKRVQVENISRISESTTATIVAGGDGGEAVSHNKIRNKKSDLPPQVLDKEKPVEDTKLIKVGRPKMSSKSSKKVEVDVVQVKKLTRQLLKAKEAEALTKVTNESSPSPTKRKSVVRKKILDTSVSEPMKVSQIEDTSNSSTGVANVACGVVRHSDPLSNTPTATALLDTLSKDSKTNSESLRSDVESKVISKNTSKMVEKDTNDFKPSGKRVSIGDTDMSSKISTSTSRKKLKVDKILKKEKVLKINDDTDSRGSSTIRNDTDFGTEAKIVNNSSGSVEINYSTRKSGSKVNISSIGEIVDSRQDYRSRSNSDRTTKNDRDESISRRSKRIKAIDKIDAIATPSAKSSDEKSISTEGHDIPEETFSSSAPVDFAMTSERRDKKKINMKISRKKHASDVVESSTSHFTANHTPATSQNVHKLSSNAVEKNVSIKKGRKAPAATPTVPAVKETSDFEQLVPSSTGKTATSFRTPSRSSSVPNCVMSDQKFDRPTGSIMVSSVSGATTGDGKGTMKQNMTRGRRRGSGADSLSMLHLLPAPNTPKVSPAQAVVVNNERNNDRSSGGDGTILSEGKRKSDTEKKNGNRRQKKIAKKALGNTETIETESKITSTKISKSRGKSASIPAFVALSSMSPTKVPVPPSVKKKGGYSDKDSTDSSVRDDDESDDSVYKKIPRGKKVKSSTKGQVKGLSNVKSVPESSKRKRVRAAGKEGSRKKNKVSDKEVSIDGLHNNEALSTEWSNDEIKVLKSSHRKCPVTAVDFWERVTLEFNKQIKKKNLKSSERSALECQSQWFKVCTRKNITR